MDGQDFLPWQDLLVNNEAPADFVQIPEPVAENMAPISAVSLLPYTKISVTLGEIALWRAA